VVSDFLELCLDVQSVKVSSQSKRGKEINYNRAHRLQTKICQVKTFSWLIYQKIKIEPIGE
jgi:hypothetical protein